MQYFDDDDESEYGMRIEKLLDEESNDYDFYFYNIHHTYRFHKKLLNLKKITSIISLMNYENEITLNNGVINEKLIGVPFIIHYSTLYYNKNLLEDRKKPSTWKELYTEILGVYRNENNNNNKDFIGYLAYLPTDSYVAIDTIQELIYSYRTDKKSKDLPEYRSKNSDQAITLLKNILTGYPTRTSYLNKTEIINKIKSGKVLFAQMHNFPNDDENINFIPLPGVSNGISASSLYGYNIGVPKHMSEDRQKKVGTILNTLMSKEINTYIIKEEKMLSAFMSIYEQGMSAKKESRDTESDTDTNVCDVVDCDMILNLQFYNKPINYYENFDDYANAFYEIIGDYFYSNNNTKIKSEEVLAKIDDLTRIYDVDITSTSGSLVIVLLGIAGVIMTASYLLTFDRKYNIYFMFLNNIYWGVFLIGTVMILMYSFVGLGEWNQSKCNLRFVLLSLGIPISFSPILLRLIVLYPENNKISEHINRNFSNYICCHVLFELMLCTFYLLSPFEVKNHLLNVSQGKENFQSCSSENIYTHIILIVNIAEKGLEILTVAILIFAEWNIKATKSDIVSFTIAIAFDILAFIIYAAFYFVKFENRYYYYYSKIGPVLLFGLSNFFFIYVWKFTIMFTSEKDEMVNKEAYLQKKTNMDGYKNITRMSLKGNRSESLDKRSIDNANGGLINKIIRCHYETVGHGPNSPDASRTNIAICSISSHSSLAGRNNRSISSQVK